MATTQVNCHGTLFSVPDALIPFMGKKLTEFIDTHNEGMESAFGESTPLLLNNQEVRAKDFDNIVKFATIAQKNGKPKIDKPLKSNKLEEWLKDGKAYQAFIA